jgi:hypothetical protein
LGSALVRAPEGFPPRPAAAKGNWSAAAPGEHLGIPVPFTADTPDETAATLEIAPDDPSAPVLRVALRSNGCDGADTTGVLVR